MATNSTVTACAAAMVTAMANPAYVATKKLQDATYWQGAYAKRLALMQANGLQGAAKAKGYTRPGVATALGLTPSQWWFALYVLPKGSPAHGTVASAIAALPAVAKAPAKATKGKATKGKATPAVTAASVL